MTESEKRSSANIESELIALKKRGGYSDELLALAKDDLLYGLKREEIELYLDKRFCISQCRKISKALRLHGPELARAIAVPEMDEHAMQVSIDFYGNGGPIRAIQENATEQISAHALKKIYRSVLDAVKEAEKIADAQKTDKEKEHAENILAQMKEIALSIRHNDEKYELLSEKLKELGNDQRYENEIELLHKRLEDKDLLLSNQQDMIQQANAAVARLRKEAEIKDKEMSKLHETVNRLEKELKEKQDMIPKNPYSVPMPYTVKMQTGENTAPVLAIIEPAQRRSMGALSVFAKLGLKKKSRQDIVKLVASGDLNTEQLIQIRAAIERGLTEEQLMNLIHSGAGAEQMKAIIEIAVLENRMKQ